MHQDTFIIQRVVKKKPNNNIWKIEYLLINKKTFTNKQF